MSLRPEITESPINSELAVAHIPALEALRLRAQLTAAATEHEQDELHLAFLVPDAQPSLAGLITTSHHQGWIESFLAESATA